MVNIFIFPNPAFTPETRILPDGTCVAHYLDTPVWCSLAGAMYVLEGSTFKIRVVSGLTPQKNYGRKTCNGCPIGRSYPHFWYRGRNYYAHKVMALSWIGPRPEGWQIDHLNGDICNWSITNLRIVTIAENHRCALILRERRRIAAQNNDPAKDPLNMRSDELLTIFNAHNCAGDVYEGE